jgi:hypothetical protein
MGTYRDDRPWSDSWIPLLRALIGPYLLGASTFEEDTQHAADLVVLSAKDMKIACRVRRQGYAERFPNEFTIRSRRANGCTTELEKIMDGWGDWLFYGHDNGRSRIDPWWLLDLSVFRAAFFRGDTILARAEVPNGDGTFFTSYPIRLFPPALVIGDSVRHRLWVRGISGKAIRHANARHGATGVSDS